MINSLPDSLLNQLPAHESIEEIPQAFSDSTHRLWHLKNTNSDKENYFLKVCSNTQSPFWQIMHGLFYFDLDNEISSFSEAYKKIDQTCSLEIPTLIEANKIRDTSYILTNDLDGVACDSDINNQMVSQLATHLAELHSLKSKRWGSLNSTRFSFDDWSKRLQISLVESDQKWGGVFLNSDSYLKQAIKTCDAIEIHEFVPMIPDLRWDQFLQKNNSLSALVDLDAFVYAPRELDFVILEYILSPSQLPVFKETYTHFHSLPDIKLVRPAYRLLLFYMQILGETDLDKWMNKVTLF